MELALRRLEALEELIDELLEREVLIEVAPFRSRQRLELGANARESSGDRLLRREIARRLGAELANQRGVARIARHAAPNVDLAQPIEVRHGEAIDAAGRAEGIAP